MFKDITECRLEMRKIEVGGIKESRRMFRDEIKRRYPNIIP